MAQIPFSVYLGWISVATIVNIASALYISGWSGWGISAAGWTVVMLVVGAAIGTIVAIQRADVAFTLVFIWAYVAIAMRQLDNPAILITALVAAIVLAVMLVLEPWR
jgi:Mg2+/Co2+ transporter CorB